MLLRQSSITINSTKLKSPLTLSSNLNLHRTPPLNLSPSKLAPSTRRSQPASLRLSATDPTASPGCSADPTSPRSLDASAHDERPSSTGLSTPASSSSPATPGTSTSLHTSSRAAASVAAAAAATGAALERPSFAPRSGRYRGSGATWTDNGRIRSAVELHRGSSTLPISTLHPFNSTAAIADASDSGANDRRRLPRQHPSRTLLARPSAPSAAPAAVLVSTFTVAGACTSSSASMGARSAVAASLDSGLRTSALSRHRHDLPSLSPGFLSTCAYPFAPISSSSRSGTTSPPTPPLAIPSRRLTAASLRSRGSSVPLPPFHRPTPTAAAVRSTSRPPSNRTSALVVPRLRLGTPPWRLQARRRRPSSSSTQDTSRTSTSTSTSPSLTFTSSSSDPSSSPSRRHTAEGS
ncbi:hypothetical protein BCR35DRAFT_213906 [Leucosporidium creatinivorum]|uniref:Uncharacterized protein n=1 Tax=Leucosporidium creatinivorum TaxID=106004 RepID=A0A1Y2DB48_9BASI|nr:hypothetical protein BCR35DRAFT_213906 [Leucosporidium creatinivorum]